MHAASPSCPSSFSRFVQSLESFPARVCALVLTRGRCTAALPASGPRRVGVAAARDQEAPSLRGEPVLIHLRPRSGPSIVPVQIHERPIGQVSFFDQPESKALKLDADEVLERIQDMRAKGSADAASMSTPEIGADTALDDGASRNWFECTGKKETLSALIEAMNKNECAESLDFMLHCEKYLSTGKPEDFEPIKKYVDDELVNIENRYLRPFRDDGRPKEKDAAAAVKVRTAMRKLYQGVILHAYKHLLTPPSAQHAQPAQPALRAQPAHSAQ